MKRGNSDKLLKFQKKWIFIIKFCFKKIKSIYDEIKRFKNYRKTMNILIKVTKMTNSQ